MFKKLGIVVYVFNPSTQEAKADGPCEFEASLHSEFWDSQDKQTTKNVYMMLDLSKCGSKHVISNSF